MNPTTTLTASEPRPRALRTFFNSTTPVKSQSSLSRSPMLAVDEVRRLLDFSSKKRPSIDQSFSSHNNGSPPPSTVSNEIEIEYYSLQKHCAKLLQNRGISPYYMSLNHSVSGGILAWCMFIIVGDEHHTIVNECVAYSPTSCVSIQVLEGDFSFFSIPFTDEDWGLETKPSPGRSIGPDWRDLDNGSIPQSSGTLGGYVYGKRTKRVFGLTCGHLVFKRPSNQPLHRPVRIQQPSDDDYIANLKSTRQAIDDSQTDEAHSWFTKQYKELEDIAYTRLLGTIIHATWNIVPNPFAVPEVADFALIHLENHRIGQNTLRIPEKLPFLPVVHGTSLIRQDEKVMKVGKSTGFSHGKISRTKAFVYHENFGTEVALGHTQGMQCDKGDSGAFIMNGSGQVVGLLVGAVKSMRLVSPDGEGEVFSQACYIEIGEALRWCGKVLGEEVDVMKTNQAFD